MILVDSGTWIDYFSGGNQSHVVRLDGALQDEEDLFTLPIVVTEVLQGFRSERDFERALTVLTTIPVFQPTLDGHVRAARLYRRLRRKGITVRGTVDCVIAQTCLDMGATLLSPDVDFDLIARSTALRVWRQAD